MLLFGRLDQLQGTDAVRWREVMAQTSAEKARKYRLANPEKCAEAHRRWRARNIDAIRMRARLAARGINKEKLRARAERVRKDNLRITNEIKMKNGCEACGYREHPAAVSYTHLRAHET